MLLLDFIYVFTWRHVAEELQCDNVASAFGLGERAVYAPIAGGLTFAVRLT
jgi:hypothetical protein